MRRYIGAFLLGILFITGVVFLFEHYHLIRHVEAYIGGAHRFSQVAYVFLLTSVGIYLPLNAVPLIPFGAAIFGPLEGALLSAFGWTLGAIGAFLIARHYGRGYVEKHIPLAKLDHIAEMLPEHNRFVALIIFRLVLPSDMASYALGLTKSLSFKHYFIATAFSYTVYSFLLSYLGHAIFEGHLLVALRIGLLLLAIFSIGWYLLNRLRN